MQGVTFGIFGLGNKQYEHFCMVGKRMQKALISLGADPIVRRGDGDDDEDIEADFDAWRTELMTALDASSHLLAIGEVCKLCLAFAVSLLPQHGIRICCRALAVLVYHEDHEDKGKNKAIILYGDRNFAVIVFHEDCQQSQGKGKAHVL